MFRTWTRSPNTTSLVPDKRYNEAHCIRRSHDIHEANSIRETRSCGRKVLLEENDEYMEIHVHDVSYVQFSHVYYCAIALIRFQR